ncbi:MAG: DUF3808 domain-containing protein [Acidobacteria bacterium]|nr:DUF3808 domain-containing protein [Acidobacteriota bacterium]
MRARLSPCFGSRSAVRAAGATLSILLAMPGAFAAEAPKGSGLQPQARIAAWETAEYTRLRLEGFDGLYNMDYPAARDRFQRMCTLAPDHPAGHLYLATTVWLNLLNSQRRLATNLYNSTSFYAETKEKVDIAIDREFRRYVGAAVKRAEEAIKRNARDVEAIYYKGAAHGLLATYEGTVARSFISALRNGSKSVALHREVLKLDPEFADAYITIGTYDYIVGSLPFFVKILAAIGGFHGSRERGLSELKTVTERGRYASDDARVVLVTFYAREKRWTDALSLLETLSAKFPSNYLFRIEKAGVLARLGRHDRSYAIFDEVLRDPAHSNVADMVHFEYAETLAGQGRYQEALDHFRAVPKQAGAAAEIVTRAHLRAGQTLDILKRRLEAIAEYQIVLARENVFDSRDKAEDGLERPFKPGDD